METMSTEVQRQGLLRHISEARPRHETHVLTDSTAQPFSVEQPVSRTESTREFLEDESEDEHQDHIDEIKDLLNQHRRLQTEQVDTRVKHENDHTDDVDALFHDFELPEDSAEGQEYETISPGDLYNYDSDGERVPFYPFKQPETFTCSFKVLGECPKPAKLKNARSVALHVKQKHPGVIIGTIE
jgi:hypothetical protein